MMIDDDLSGGVVVAGPGSPSSSRPYKLNRWLFVLINLDDPFHVVLQTFM